MDPLVSSAGPHLGEEPPLVGRRGSGTIFFSSCNLKCLFCQNFAISQERRGAPVTRRELADIMLQLQQIGCHNINLVTPTHVVPQIVDALSLAVDLGLRLPVVYNCGGYESVETLRLLDGVVDIYMPDIKYSDDSYAVRYSGARNYWDIARAAVKEMYRQVGSLVGDPDGTALRGLLVRHLVLPNGRAGSRKVLEFIAQEISRDTYVNIMDQYHPAHRAGSIRELSRCVSSGEVFEVIEYAKSVGLYRGFAGAERLKPC